MHEIAQALKRRPISLAYVKGLKLAQFIVESKKNIEVNEMTEDQLTNILSKLAELIGETLLTTQEQFVKLQDSLISKLGGKFGQFVGELQSSSSIDTGCIPASSLELINGKLNLQLTRDEIDYMILIMYKDERCFEKLLVNVLIQHFEALGLTIVNQSKEPEKILHNPNKEEEKNTDIINPKSDAKQATDMPVPEVPPKEEKEGVNEDQMIDLAQRCFYSIAGKMIEKKQNVLSLYQDAIFKKTIEQEEVELITPMDFINGLRKLGIEDLQTLDYTCLIKVLAINEEEKLIRVNDLVQILEDYGITDKDSIEQQFIDELKFEDLDKVSLVLMLALTEYLIRAKKPLYDLFGEVIFKQTVQIDNKQLQLDLINSADFFSTLKKIGINIEEKEHENLKIFLCLDSSYPDKLLVDKIKKSIEEFATNDELRTYAQQCYQELAEVPEEKKAEPM